MEKNLKQAIEHRRSYYNILNSSPINDDEIIEIVKFVATHTPSAFNSQTTRLVLLLGENHKKLWNIVKSTLRKIVPVEAFAATENKINSFAAGYGSVLFFEDMEIVKSLQNKFASYAENFPVWSQQTSAMHQFAVWTALENAGLGASLQHYNPLIDKEVAETWGLPESWKLIAQMPFGTPGAEPFEKEFEPIDKKVKIFK